MSTFIKFVQEDVALEYHDTLNERLWSHQVLDEEVHRHLMKIADTFIGYLDIPVTAVKDIVLCGGNANYNYTKFSDIDIHLIVNEHEIATCPNYLSMYFMAKKTLWSYEHDITVKGYPVELYAQPVTEKFVNSQGVYSLQNRRWVQEPTKMDVNLNDINLLTKVEEFQKQIDLMVESPVADAALLKILKEKLKRMRKEALQKAGEFSFGNLVFKALRNSGYLEKLTRLEKTSQDLELSLK